MVYCTKCGTKNPDDAEVCSKCGAPLNPEREERQRYYRRYEQECFGIPHGGAIVLAAIGVIIVLAGLMTIVGHENIIWPLVLIIFGVLIVIGALYRMSHKY